MTPLDQWTEFRDLASSSPGHKVPESFPRSEYRSLREAHDDMDGVDFAMSLLVAYATVWKENLLSIANHGKNEVDQETARTIIKSDYYKTKFSENLGASLKLLKQQYPTRKPLFLLYATQKEVERGHLNLDDDYLFPFVKKFNYIKNAFVHEFALVLNLRYLKYDAKRIHHVLIHKERANKPQEGSQRWGYSKLFAFDFSKLRDLIIKSKIERSDKFLETFFPGIKYVSKHRGDETKYDNILLVWKAMWLILKEKNIDKRKEAQYEVYKKYGISRTVY